MGENPFQSTEDIEMPDFDELPKVPKNDNLTTQKPVVSNMATANPNPLPNPAKQYTADKRAKLEALKQREAELLEKKKKLEKQTNELTPTPNFPSFFPLIRYNPEEDLPPASHACIKNSMKSLGFLTLTACFNIIAILSVSGLKNFQKIRSFIFAVIQGFVAVYLTLNFGYNLLYSSCKRRDIPFKWTIYQFIIVAWCIYLTIGFPTSGSVGIATLLDIIANDSPIYSKLFALINTVLCGAAAGFSMLTLSTAQAYQKVSGQEDPLINAPEP